MFTSSDGTPRGRSSPSKTNHPIKLNFNQLLSQISLKSNKNSVGFYGGWHSFISFIVYCPFNTHHNTRVVEIEKSVLSLATNLMMTCFGVKTCPFVLNFLWNETLESLCCWLSWIEFPQGEPPLSTFSTLLGPVQASSLLHPIAIAGLSLNFYKCVVCILDVSLAY